MVTKENSMYYFNKKIHWLYSVLLKKHKNTKLSYKNVDKSRKCKYN